VPTTGVADVQPEREDRITGCLLGLAVGDSLGLPFEGLRPERAVRLFGGAAVGHRLLFGRGLTSDDTEHAAMTAQSVLASPDDAARFSRSLAWRLRLWLLGLPAGIGLATGRSILKLWLGMPPSRSGVRSAGNGPAMRAPILGVLFSEDAERRAAFVRASTRITHTDPRAEEGAQLLARAAAEACRRPAGALDRVRLLADLIEGTEGRELAAMLRTAQEHLTRGASPAELAVDIHQGRGISGYINHTVPAALYCWLAGRGDFRGCVESAIRLGGDTDTVAGIVGALCGAELGQTAIPREWLEGVVDWPRSIAWLRALARRLTLAETGTRPGAQPLFWPGLLVRNPVFLLVVLFHGFRRLLPPY
jgi:ADP-ribosyl-[dinitrogen reductase] hydrolase